MIDYKYADLFTGDSTDKQLTITYDNGTITNEILWQEEFELTESLCSEESLKFGSCEAAELKFRVSNIVEPLIGKWLTVSMVIAGNTDTPFQIGKYKVASDVPTADRTYRDVTAYDAMYDIINSDVADWYNEILPNSDSTVTMKEFRTSFIKHFDLLQVSADLINDDMVIQKTVTVAASEETDTTSTIGEAMSGKEVITAICEINGCFGHIDRDGNFKYVYLDQNIQGLFPRDDLYPEDDLYPGSTKTTQLSNASYYECTYEDYETQKIDKLQIRQDEDDIGVVVGSGDNSYTIEGNFLAYKQSTEDLTKIAKNIYAYTAGSCFRPFECKAVGNPCLEVGDAVQLNTTREIIFTYILQRTLSGIQALTDTYKSTGEETYSEPVNSVSRELIKLTGKSNTLSRTIDETKSELKDTANNLSTTITQTAETITADLNKQITETKQYADNAASTAEANANTSTDDKLKSYTTTTDMNAKFEATAEGFNTTVEKTTTELKQYADNAASTAEANANTSTDDKLKSYSTTTEMTSAINQTANSITSTVSETYATKDETTNTENTSSLASQIKQNAKNIDLKVEKDGIIAAINLSTEKDDDDAQVTIDASKINLNGAVTANNNVVIDTDGKITAIDANLSGVLSTIYGNIQVKVGEGELTLLYKGTDDTEWTEYGRMVALGKLGSNACKGFLLDSLNGAIVAAGYSSGGNSVATVPFVINTRATDSNYQINGATKTLNISDGGATIAGGTNISNGLTVTGGADITGALNAISGMNSYGSIVIYRSVYNSTTGGYDYVECGKIGASYAGSLNGLIASGDYFLGSKIFSGSSVIGDQKFTYYNSTAGASPLTVNITPLLGTNGDLYVGEDAIINGTLCAGKIQLLRNSTSATTSGIRTQDLEPDVSSQTIGNNKYYTVGIGGYNVATKGYVDAKVSAISIPAVPTQTNEIKAVNTSPGDSTAYRNLLIAFNGSTDNEHDKAATGAYVRQYHGNNSDKRLKKEIKTISDIAEKYMAINAVEFKYKKECGRNENPGKKFGYIANELNEIFPEDEFAIVERSEFKPSWWDYQDMPFILNYENMHALHTAMIQKHEREIESLKSEIQELKSELSEIKSLIQQLTGGEA